MKRWLLEPLRNPAEILHRQQAVRELQNSERISAALAEVYDLERIAGRVTARLANPRDTLALGRSLAQLPELGKLLERSESPLLKSLHQKVLELSGMLHPLGKQILDTQKEEAPLVAREGGIFRTGTHKDLDRLLSLAADGSRWLVELETRERESTGIPSLKVRYNRVFGYYIEITQAHSRARPRTISASRPPWALSASSPKSSRSSRTKSSMPAQDSAPWSKNFSKSSLMQIRDADPSHHGRRQGLGRDRFALRAGRACARARLVLSRDQRLDGAGDPRRSPSAGGFSASNSSRILCAQRPGAVAPKNASPW